MDTAAAHPAARDRTGFVSFLSEGLTSLLRREMLIPAGLLVVLLTWSNIVILQNMPAEGATPSSRFVMAAALRVIGLMIIAVAILRVAARSDRPTWRPDGAFWLYQFIAPLGLGASLLVRALIGEGQDPASLFLSSAASTLVAAPFAAWFTAIAVERPLAWNPLHWMRAFGRWLPQLLVWSLLLVVPMATLHAWIDIALIGGVGDWFWPAVLFDGPLSALMVLVGIGLSVAAYRRVAQG